MTETPLLDTPELAGRRVLLGLTGGIACYKAAELCRLLVRSGAQVRVAMTHAACRFITPLTMQALCGQPVFTSQWDARPHNHMAHIELGREAELILVAPASADFIAQLAGGRADELLALLCLARPDGVPLLLAPAMNRQMWQHPATQRNVHQVSADGASVLGVASGAQACGEVGEGRMLAPEQLLQCVTAALAPKSLAGLRVLISAGPTFEAIDPVRGITNLSSGKMGFAMARAAFEAGAQVQLVAGPVHVATPYGVQRTDVTSALQMHAAVMEYATQADIFIATAAVADWRPAEKAAQKIKKDGSGDTPALHFVENPDILADVARSPRAVAGQLFCVGFAAESENLLEYAAAKRQCKGVPLLAANIGAATFGRDDNALLLVDESGTQQLPRASKRVLAQRLIAEIARRLPGAAAA